MPQPDAERQVLAAVGRGVRQYVVLAAGLDTSGVCLLPTVTSAGGTLEIFEVDRPAMSAWKQDRLTATGASLPPSLHFVPTDLTTDPATDPATDGLAARLAAHGFRPGEPAVVSWLGCVMYLRREEVDRVLRSMTHFAAGTHVMFDYLAPRHLQDDAGRLHSDAVAAMASGNGEPRQTLMAPPEVAGLLASSGLDLVADLDQQGMTGTPDWNRADALRPARLQRLAHARVPAA